MSGGILYKFELNENRDGFRFDNNELEDLVLNKEDNPSEIIFGTGFAGITDIKEGPRWLNLRCYYRRWENFPHFTSIK